MTRRLLIAFAAVLAIGALLDATVHRDAVGMRTVGHDRARAAAGPEVVRDRSVATLVGTAWLLDWYTLPLALREIAPGAELIIDSGGSAQRPLSEVHLRAIGAARSVRSEDLSGVVLPIGAPDLARDAFWYGPWELYLGEGRIDTLLVFPSRDVTRVVDVRRAFGAPGTSGAPMPAEQVTSARAADAAPSFARALTLDTLAFVVFLLVGGLLVPRDVVSAGLRPAVALLVGVALHASAGLLLLPGYWGIVLTVLLAGVLGAISRRLGWDVGWARADIRVLLPTSVAIALTVAWARWSAFLVLTPDSRDYWSGGALFADGVLRPGLIELKRGLSLQALHAVGFAGAIEGLQALNAILLVVVCATLLGLAVARPSGAERSRVLLAAVLVAAFVVSPQIRSIAAFLSGHALVAALLLGLLILIGLGSDRRLERLPILAIVPVLGALVLTRAEGSVLAGAVLLGALAAESEARRWRGAWLGLAGSTFAWAALLWLGDLDRTAMVSTGTLILAMTAVGAVGMALLVTIVPGDRLRWVPTVALAALWVGFAAVTSAGDRVAFVDAAVENHLRGHGRWGVYGALLLIASALAVAISQRRRSPAVAAAVWFVLAYIPVTAFVKLGDGLEAAGADVAILLSGGGRVGWGDSVNRMWFHLVPVVLALLVTYRSTEPRDPRPRAGLRTMLVLVPAVATAVLWEPQYVPTRTVEESVVLSITGSDALAELPRGVAVDQLIALPELELPPGAVLLRVCAAIPMITFGRDIAGDVEVVMVAGQERASRIVPGGEAVDWAAQRICVRFDTGSATPAALPDEVAIRVTGVDGQPGSSLGVLKGGAGAGPPTVRLPDGTLAFQDTSIGPLAADITVGYLLGTGGVGAVLEQLVPILPWAGVLLAVLVAAGLWRGGVTKSRRG